MEHVFSIKGACLDNVVQEVGTVSLNLRFLDAQIFIRFLASLVAIESTTITSKKRLIFNIKDWLNTNSLDGVRAYPRILTKTCPFVCLFVCLFVCPFVCPFVPMGSLWR
jgi:hypothetical protein